MQLLETKSIFIDDREFILSKFPAVAGREIVVKYPLSGLPKIGEYKVNEETMLKLMSYVGINSAGTTIRLSTQALIDNHVGNWETLVKIEWAMLEYNCSFFQSGRASTFLEGIAQKVPQWISKILTGLSEQSSQMEKPRSTN
jgi:hypothetical protein